MRQRFRPILHASLLLTLLLLVALWAVQPRPGLRARYEAPGAPGPGAQPLAERLERPRDSANLVDTRGLRLPPTYKVVYEGKLHVTLPTRYAFALVTSDTARMWIGGELVAFGSQTSSSLGASRVLGRGLHALKIEYLRQGPSARPPALRLDWSEAWFPGTDFRRPLPLHALLAPSAAQWRLTLRWPLGFFCVLGLGVTTLVAPRSRTAARRVRRLLFRLVAAGSAMGFVLLLAELLLRLAGVQSLSYIPADIWMTYNYAPGVTIRYQGCTPLNVKEFENPATLNSQWRRDREYPPQKPAGAFRIVVLGDSFVEGLEVPLEATFHKLLEARLTAEFGSTGRRFEVISLARGGHSTLDELNTLLKDGLALHPDLVLLSFYPGNDVRGNSAPLSARYGAWVHDVYYQRVVRARLQFLQHFLIFDRSRLNHFLVDRLLPLYSGNLHLFQRDLARQDLQATDIEVYRRGPYPPEWEEAWRITRETLRQVRQATESNGARFKLLLVHSTQITGYDSDRLAANRDGQFDLERPGRRIREFCAAEGIDLIDMKPALTAFAARTGQRYSWRYDAHWNPNGHRVTAEACYQALLPVLLQSAAPNSHDVRQVR